MFLLPASMKKIRSKLKALEWSQHFPHYNPMGAIRCHGHQSSDPIWPKTLCSLSPIPMMVKIKFRYDWPTGLQFTYKILSKNAKWFLLLALKFDLCVKYVKVNLWSLFKHTMMGLM